MQSELTGLEQAGILVGVVAGVGGLAVSVVSLLFQWREAKPRLRARFGIYTQIDRTHGPGGAVQHDVGVVEVANIGRVPVVAAQVGIIRTGKRALLVISPTPLDGGAWPREIEPGRVCHLKFITASMREEARKGGLRRAFVSSAVGETFLGPRKDVREFLKQLESPPEPR